MKNKRMFIIILTLGILVTVTYVFLSGEEKKELLKNTRRNMMA